MNLASSLQFQVVDNERLVERGDIGERRFDRPKFVRCV
jgi:hypothetical protein